MNSYCKNQELTKEPYITWKIEELFKKMIRLFKELNAALSFIKWDLRSLQNLSLWLVARFLLFSIFACFTLSYPSHALNHPFVFPCSHVHSLVSQLSGLNCASASGNFSVSSASQRAHVYFQSPDCWKHSSLQA